MGKFNTIIFDLGGVVIDLFVDRTFDGFSELSGKSWKEVAKINGFHDDYFAFERGQMTGQEYRSVLSRYLEIDVDDHQFDEIWNRMLGEIPSNRIHWIKEMGEAHQLAILSNTNSIHVEAFEKIFREHSGVFPKDMFDQVFYSCEVGHRKPDHSVFELVIQELDCNPGKTLFLDDTQDNIDAAAKLGIVGRFVNRNQLTRDHFNDE